MAINKPSKKKITFPSNPMLDEYLEMYGRKVNLPLDYDDLLRFDNAIPLYDQQGEDTLWKTVLYPPSDMDELNRGLKFIYSLLKTDGDIYAHEHLTVARVDFCTFGNSKPFRIRIINKLNDNYDHFYVKRTDASRIFGLELEHILSPDFIQFFVDGETLVEEHIAGIPGDDFIKYNLDDTEFNQIRIAKEFVKFNERCFVRLLGDMRSYNFVVDITPDIDGIQYRLRAIDFDQQCYEGRKSFYLPQYFKENNPIVYLGIKHMSARTVMQYQMEERSLIAMRVRSTMERTRQVLGLMQQTQLSTPKKVKQLRKELSRHHKNDAFLSCENMGQIVLENIELLLNKGFTQSIVLT